ncbi:MAG: hypothetical protein Q6373_025685 [Candidatus Sigynarchaeota archaeon]
MTIAHQKKLELGENEAWDYYTYLLQKQRNLSEKLVVASKDRNRDLIKELVAESKEISRKLDHVDEFLDQFE